MATTDERVLKKEVLQLIIQTYISEALNTPRTLSFRSPEFMALLTKYEETIPALERICAQSIPLPADGYDEREVRKKALLSNSGTDLLPDAEMGLSEESNREFLLLTIEKEAEPVIDVDMTVFVINASSTKIDLAVEYLQLYLENMSERERIQYFPSADNPVLIHYYPYDKALFLEDKAALESRLTMAKEEEQADIKMQLLSVESNLDALEKNKWAITKESIEKYDAATKHMKVYENIGINFFSSSSFEVISLLNQYLDGAITKEQFVNRYDDMVRMVFSEID